MRVEHIGDATLYLADCMDIMRDMPDKAFDIAIVDPPYGDCGGQWENRKRSRFGGRFDKYSIGESTTPTADTLRAIPHWDIAPPQEYFDELFRVSKHQVIWGGNYFALPPSRNFLIWRKLTISESFSMAMAEYAWTSFPGNAKVFECAPQDPTRFHPTQKPVALYRWILSLFAKPGDTILDTHFGSGSCIVACAELGYKATGCEINQEYFDKAIIRIAEAYRQPLLFDDLADDKNKPVEQELGFEEAL